MNFVEDKAFRAQWWAIKQENKRRLAQYVETTLGYKINTDAMFDIQVKVSEIPALRRTMFNDVEQAHT